MRLGQQLAPSSEHRVTSFRIIALPLLIASVGCALQISNKVSPQEYAVYRAWVTQHFEKSPPVQLMFEPFTVTKDPLEFPSCKDELHKNGVSWSLMKELSALGDAKYPLDSGYLGLGKLPWKFTMFDSRAFPHLNSTGGRYKYNAISFTRVAFNRSKTEALFYFEDENGATGMAGAGFRHARLVDGKWNFEKAGCDGIIFID